MTLPALDPCPFCGGDVFLRTLPDGRWDVAHRRWSLCSARVQVGPWSSARRAVGAWNRRALGADAKGGEG